MADGDNTGKVIAGVGLGAALLGVLAALGGKKKVGGGGVQGPEPVPTPRKGCNCGR